MTAATPNPRAPTRAWAGATRTTARLAFATGPGLAMLRAELTAILALLKPRA
ncbi:hypothetical protein LP419_36875 [Massilia sp. H-1]|nr:hypothetical protein LP419_36875 [Massilia sp. H-1]